MSDDERDPDRGGGDDGGGDGRDETDAGTDPSADSGRDDPPAGEFVGVIDRFEGDLAVVMLERDAETVGDVAVPRERLPEDARRPDAVLHVTVEAGRAVDVRYDEAETDRRAERAQSRFDRLSSRRDADGDPNDVDDAGSGN